MKLSEIRDLFLNEQIRKSIFSALEPWEKTNLEKIARLYGVGPKYSTTRKLKGLQEHLPKTGELYMSELPGKIGKPSLQIVICSFDYERNREVFFRSNKTSMADSAYYDFVKHGNPAGKFVDVKLAEAVHGSSNAPVNYFDKPGLIEYRNEQFHRQFWDGAVGGYNNPVFAGVLEAIANGNQATALQVLSIGTGSNLLPLYQDLKYIPDVNEFLYLNTKSNFINDIQKMATAVLADPPDSASFHAYTMMHSGVPENSTRFFRFSPLIKPIFNTVVNRWEIPAGFTADEFEQLIKLDMDAVDQAQVKLIDQLIKEWMNPKGEIDNQAIRCNSMLNAIIGYGKYAEAKTAFVKYFKNAPNV